MRQSSSINSKTQNRISLTLFISFGLCETVCNESVCLIHSLTSRRPLQPGGELGPGPADRRGVHHQPGRAGLLRMPGRFQPAQQLRLDRQEPQRHAGHHRGPAPGGALLQAGPGRGLPVPCLQQRDEEAGRGPVYAGGGQLRDRWVEGGAWVDAGSPRRQAHSKQRSRPKAEEAYELSWQGLDCSTSVGVTTVQGRI